MFFFRREGFSVPLDLSFLFSEVGDALFMRRAFLGSENRPRSAPFPFGEIAPFFLLGRRGRDPFFPPKSGFFLFPHVFFFAFFFEFWTYLVLLSPLLFLGGGVGVPRRVLNPPPPSPNPPLHPLPLYRTSLTPGHSPLPTKLTSPPPSSPLPLPRRFVHHPMKTPHISSPPQHHRPRQTPTPNP